MTVVKKDLLMNSISSSQLVFFGGEGHLHLETSSWVERLRQTNLLSVRLHLSDLRQVHAGLGNLLLRQALPQVTNDGNLQFSHLRILGDKCDIPFRSRDLF